jgi:hypothetical protein
VILKSARLLASDSSSAAMTEGYTGEIPLNDVRTEFSMKFGTKINVLEIMETGAAAQVF